MILRVQRLGTSIVSAIASIFVKPGFHIIAPSAPIAPITQNSVQAMRAIHYFHLIAPIACEVECTGQVLDPSLMFSRQME